MYIRPQAETLKNRLLEPVSRLVVITGPRQIGKSTLVQQVLGKLSEPLTHEYIPVDEPLDEAKFSPVVGGGSELMPSLGTIEPDIPWLVEVWKKARKKAQNSKRGHILVLDEIQKIPQWSEAVKGLWEADRRAELPMHVVLLGSAPLLMQKGLKESLAGRFEVIRMRHWSFQEMNKAFDYDLQRYVYFGGYPGAASLSRDGSRWKQYMLASLIQPNIEKDILMMTRVDKPALLKNLFELGCHYSGQELSYNKMLGQLQDAGNTTTLAGYLNLLESADLLSGLQKFSMQQVRRRSSSPKLNIHNSGLMAALSGYTFEEAKADRTFWGRLTESAVGAHLINASNPEVRLYYWRDGHDEVDFILEKGGRRIAIEVKSGAGGRRRSGLDKFVDQFKPHKGILVGDMDIPLHRFLATPPDEWFKDS